MFMEKMLVGKTTAIDHFSLHRVYFSAWETRRMAAGCVRLTITTGRYKRPLSFLIA